MEKEGLAGSDDGKREVTQRHCSEKQGSSAAVPTVLGWSPSAPQQLSSFSVKEIEPGEIIHDKG